MASKRITLWKDTMSRDKTRSWLPRDLHRVGMFYRQHMLVIDGKYNIDDGLSIATMISSVVIIGEEQQP
jgi:hypothetical protein